MREVRATALPGIFLGLVLFLTPLAAAAQTDCPTQRAFALALAQILGFDVSDQTAAIATLSAVGVEPEGGWQAGDCLTAEVVEEMESDLKAAMNANLIDPQDVRGAIAFALDTIGAPDLFDGGMPSPFPRRATHVGGPPLEGARELPPGPPQPPPGPPPTTTTTRPPASPFIP